MTYKLAYAHAMKSQDMADDIDDLLREVEEKYLPKQSTAAASLNTSNTPNQNQQHQYRYATTSAPAGFSQQQRDKKMMDESFMKKTDIPSIVTKTTTRAHSSDIVCRELEDELSDLLDDDGRMSDAATVSLRCKRSPRRSASARELIVNTVDAASNSTASTANGENGDRAQSFDSTNKEMSTSVYNSSSSTTTTQLGSRSAPPTYHHQHSHANRAHQANVCADVHVEKQKCFPIYLSGVIDSIDASQAVRVCSSLRCTGCDFRVSQFAHYRWRPGTDYLFLRNHMPEFDRVRVKLAAAKFCRAYACQCKFVTVKDLVDLNKLGHEFASKWICLGH